MENNKEFDDNRFEQMVKAHYLNKEAEEVLNKHRSKKPIFNFSLQKIGIAASLILISFSMYLSFNKNYLSDLILEKNNMRGTINNDSIRVTPQELAYKNFMIGKANYIAHDYIKAIENYQAALNTPNLRNQIAEAIKWHLCVAYLLNNQPNEASAIMKELDEISNPKYEIGTINKLKIKTQIFLNKLF